MWGTWDADVRNLTRTVLNSPMGQMLKPFLDQFRNPHNLGHESFSNSQQYPVPAPSRASSSSASNADASVELGAPSPFCTRALLVLVLLWGSSLDEILQDTLTLLLTPTHLSPGAAVASHSLEHRQFAHHYTKAARVLGGARIS